MKVYTTTDDSGLIWTDPEVFKRFAIGPLIYGLDPEDRKEAFESYMKMTADELADHRDTAGSYTSFDTDTDNVDINDKYFTNNLSLRDLYEGGNDPFDADLYDLLDSKDTDVTVTEVDVDDDGDTDATGIDTDGDGENDAEIVTAEDENEEQQALDNLDKAADNAAAENPISIDKVDAMADEAAKDNEYSLDAVDAMADADAARLDSTGNKSYLSKRTPEQRKIEELAAGTELSDARKKRIANMTDNWGKTSKQKKEERPAASKNAEDNANNETQKNILAALQGRLL